MVVPEADMMSHDEVESPLRQDQQSKIHPFSSLPRQSSIYSLTLDEFQQSLCESGRNFSSMNMDEFLNSIWTAEENQAHAHAQGQTHITGNNSNDYNNTHQFLMDGSTNSKPIAKQVSLSRQASLTLPVPLYRKTVDEEFPMDGSTNSKPIAKKVSLSRQVSLTLPSPLCRKTVDEVWSEIHRTRQEQEQQQQQNNPQKNQGSTHRQPTFGEMTLEDFLVKAGVVQEQCNPPAQQPPYRMFRQLIPPTIGPSFGSGFGTRPVVGNIPPYQPLAQGAEPTEYNGKRGGGYPSGPPMMGVNYGRVNGGGYGLGESPVSPQSDEMEGGGQFDGSSQYGMDMSEMRGGRKKIIDGPVEKVMERRQRRMIKNRESAARSRTRKQAYTVELEAELNQLKDENAQLKHALAELERKSKQQYFEDSKMKAQTKAQKAKERIRMMQRSFSCPV